MLITTIIGMWVDNHDSRRVPGLMDKTLHPCACCTAVLLKGVSTSVGVCKVGVLRKLE